ncbi:MAG: hypothetical protein WCV72_05225 [Patescibacteria group bacterium]
MDTSSETEKSQSKDLLLNLSQDSLAFKFMKIFVEKADFEVLLANNVRDATSIIMERLNLSPKALIALLSNEEMYVFKRDLAELYKNVIKELEIRGVDRQIIRNQVLIICSDKVSAKLRSCLGNIYEKKTKKMITPQGTLVEGDPRDLTKFLVKKREEIRESKK